MELYGNIAYYDIGFLVNNNIVTKSYFYKSIIWLHV